MKKIVFHLNCLAFGGTERVVTNLAARFAQEDYEVIVATEWQDKEEYTLDKKVRREIVGLTKEDEKKGRIAKIILRHLRLRQFVKKERPDVIVAMGRKANYRAIAATLGMKQKVVVCVRTDPTGHYDSLSDKIQIPLLFPKAAGFVFQTVGQRDFFPERCRKNATVILNPLNPKYIGLPVVTERKKEVVHSGRVQGFKNHQMLIRAFHKVHQKHPDYVLKCYGPDAGDGSFQAALQTIEKLGAKEYIFMMGGSDSLEKELPAASVYAYSSDWEGLPNAVLEAMAMGLPVVSTDCPCGGPATVIRHEENGLLVPIKDEDALAAGICRLIEDRDFAEKLGKEARRISEIANDDAVFAQWRDWLNAL